MNRELITKWLMTIKQNPISEYCEYDHDGESCSLYSDDESLEFTDFISFTSIKEFLINHKYIVKEDNRIYKITKFGDYYLNQLINNQEFLIARSLWIDVVKQVNDTYDLYEELLRKSADAAVLQFRTYQLSDYVEQGIPKEGFNND